MNNIRINIEINNEENGGLESTTTKITRDIRILCNRFENELIEILGLPESSENMVLIPERRKMKRKKKRDNISKEGNKEKESQTIKTKVESKTEKHEKTWLSFWVKSKMNKSKFLFISMLSAKEISVLVANGNPIIIGEQIIDEASALSFVINIQEKGVLKWLGENPMFLRK